MGSIEDFREYYARLVVGLAGSSDERIVAAFASTPRERFAGPGPWQFHVGRRYDDTPSTALRVTPERALAD